MKLTQKTFGYSVAIAAFLVVFFLVYMVYFLPNLYINHLQKQNEQMAVDLHFEFLEKRSYQELTPWNVQSSMSFVLPLHEDKIYFYSKLTSGNVTFKDPQLNELLNQYKEFLKHPKKEFPITSDHFNQTVKRLIKSLPLEMVINETGANYDDYYRDENMNLRMVGQNTVLASINTRGEEANYSVVFLVTNETDGFVQTFIPVVNPNVQQILPVVANSLPMVMVILFLTVLLASAMFSKSIVDPVMTLVKHTRELKDRSPNEYFPLEMKRNDEIAELSRSLNELQETIKEQYTSLENQSQTQAVLLRAGSHQLKTPIAASLLLVEGMIGQVGKYKDTQAYLPELRRLLRSMQGMINSILDMNKPLPLERRKVNLHHAVEQNTGKTGALLDAKQLIVLNRTEHVLIDVPELFDWILMILIENALIHTPQGEAIKIWNQDRNLYIENSGSHIPEDELPHIFTPFVKGQHSTGHGLGLYLASYYAKVMQWTIDLRNTSSGVVVCFNFSKNTSRTHIGYTEKI